MHYNKRSSHKFTFCGGADFCISPPTHRPKFSPPLETASSPITTLSGYKPDAHSKVEWYSFETAFISMVVVYCKTTPPCYRVVSYMCSKRQNSEFFNKLLKYFFCVLSFVTSHVLLFAVSCNQFIIKPKTVFDHVLCEVLLPFCVYDLHPFSFLGVYFLLLNLFLWENFIFCFWRPHFCCYNISV